MSYLILCLHHELSAQSVFHLLENYILRLFSKMRFVKQHQQAILCGPQPTFIFLTQPKSIPYSSYRAKTVNADDKLCTCF